MGLCDRFGAVVCIEFFVEGAQLRFDGVDRDVQRVRNICRLLSGDQLRKKFLLTCGEFD